MPVSTRTPSISTSFVERRNLTMRMGIRRFTRLTNAFSRKVENHEAAVALHFMHYNFCRVHQILRVSQRWKPGSLRTSGQLLSSSACWTRWGTKQRNLAV